MPDGPLVDDQRVIVVPAIVIATLKQYVDHNVVAVSTAVVGVSTHSER